MQTGEDSQAAVALDENKTIYLDANSRVQFIREGRYFRVCLEEGLVLVDVRKKLDENESLNIMIDRFIVDIRGTILYAETKPDGHSQCVGVLEGTTTVDYTDQSGTHRLIPVSAGNRIAFPVDDGGALISPPNLNRLVSKDLQGFVAKTVTESSNLTDRVIEANENGDLLLTPGGVIGDGKGQLELFPANANWVWSGLVTLTAPSGSKLYDGTPLTCSSGALVSSLPVNFNIQVTASGSQTNAGSCETEITSFTITNSTGDDVTSHFTNVETLPGKLVVDPYPLIVQTGSAEKEYDGKALTCDKAEIRSSLNNSAEGTALGSEQMVAVSGSNFVQGETAAVPPAIPDSDITVEVTGSQTEPGQSDNTCNIIWGNANPNNYTVSYDLGTLTVTTQSGVRTLTIATGSAEKVYDGTPLTCNEVTVTGQAYGDNVTVTATGSQTEAGESKNNYQINWGSVNSSHYTIDSRNLGTLKVKPLELAVSFGVPEVTYSGFIWIPNPVITYLNGPHQNESVTGMRIMASSDGFLVGSSPEDLTSGRGSETDGNPDGSQQGQTDSIGINPDNETSLPTASIPFHFTLYTGDTVDLTVISTGISAGVYTVYASVSVSSTSIVIPDQSFTTGKQITIQPAVLTITTGSKEKEFDDTPLTCSDVTVSGLKGSDTVTVTATGSINEVGETENTYSIDWGNTNKNNYTIAENLGTLTITEPKQTHLTVTVIANQATKEYNGEEQTVEGYTLATSGEQYTMEDFTYTGTYAVKRTNCGTSYFTLDGDKFQNLNESFNVSFVVSDGYLRITPATLSITTGSASKTYDGTPLTCSEVTVSGLKGNDTISVTATGNITEVGATENTYSIDWGSTNAGNYTIEENLGTLTVTEPIIEVTVTVTGNQDTKEYTGQEQSVEGYTVAISDERYTVDDFTFSGTAAAKGTNPGTYLMGLDPDQFTNNNDAFAVTFSVTDGKLVINEPVVPEKVPVTVSITGNKNSVNYDGGEHSVEGYTVSISDSRYTEEDFIFTGSAMIEGTNAGVYYMGLTEDQFVNNNNAFDVTFSVDDGCLEIDPAVLEIAITGNNSTVTYDGAEHSVTGYSVSIPDGAALTADDISGPAQSAAIAKGTNANGGSNEDKTYPMGLSASAFSNTNGNYNVTFSVTDGWLKITPIPLTYSIGTASCDPFTVEGYTPTSVLTCANTTLPGTETKRADDENNSYYFYSEYDLPTGDSVRLEIRNTPKEGAAPGTYPVYASWAISGTASNYSYDASASVGTFTINPFELSVQTASESKPYDGLPDPVSSATKVDCQYFEITATAIGSTDGADVGEHTNIYKLNWGETATLLGVSEGTNIADYFNITESLGTLTIEKCPVTINLGGSTTTPVKISDLGPNTVPMTGTFSDGSAIPVTYSTTTTGYTAVFTLKGSDTLSLEWTYPTAPSASYTIAPTVTFSGSSKDNYDINYNNNTLSIYSTEDVNQ